MHLHADLVGVHKLALLEIDGSVAVKNNTVWGY
jgi:hypothetical protein